MPEIIKIKPRKSARIAKRRVAAYCRVSTLKEAQQGSYDLQMSYYNRKIQENPNWEFAGIYSDQGISGTGIHHRIGFQKMLEVCEKGKIDLILTKSIKRFARNTVDLLETIRQLKEIGVEVIFENENISTFSQDGDFMLTILASFAQEESRGMSENIRWAIKKRFENGEPWVLPDCYGYKSVNGQYYPVPEQPPIVQRIFKEVLSGKQKSKVAEDLNRDGYRMFSGGLWNWKAIWKIIRNINYTGNLVLQKTYSPDLRTIVENRGQVDSYFVPETHEPLVSLEDWQAAQACFRQLEHSRTDPRVQELQGKVICRKCNKPYWHHDGYWICKSKFDYWKNRGELSDCPRIPDYVILEISAETTDRIWVEEDGSLTIQSKKGEERILHWNPRTKLWGVDSPEELSKERKCRDTNKEAKRKGDLSCFVKCGKCGMNFNRYGGDQGLNSRYRTRCKHQKTFKEADLKEAIVAVLDLPNYQVAEQDRLLSHCSIDDGLVTFHFRDGRTTSRRLYGKNGL